MKLNLITVICVLLAALLVGTVAAFLLLVPVMSVAAVSTVLLASILMFGLGLNVGRRRIRIVREKPSPILS